MFAVPPRLLLRPGWPEDAEALFAAINDQAIVRNLVKAPWPYRLEDARQFLSLPSDPASPRWLIFSRTDGAPQLAGCIGLDALENGDVEIGYWISLGHRRLVASHFVDNPASGTVLRKLGFTPTGQTIGLFSRGRNREVQAVEFSCLLEDKQTSEVMRPLAA